ncbi:MAG TPA: MBL fold metallo-hydrolase, partial [Candidatus Paceibacterota bacterium]|nr:MBL fold metallo-hydrolase [Candidatus Paceibacterota bacterium]
GNSAMQKLLEAEEIACTLVGEGGKTEVRGVLVEGFGTEHALVYPPDTGKCENTGYMIDGQFYFPGDAFHTPGKAVDVLALPVAGPWMKASDAVDFAKAIKPRIAIGVHDGIVQPFFRGFIGNLMAKFVPEMEYVSLQDGESREF